MIQQTQKCSKFEVFQAKYFQNQHGDRTKTIRQPENYVSPEAQVVQLVPPLPLVLVNPEINPKAQIINPELS